MKSRKFKCSMKSWFQKLVSREVLALKKMELNPEQASEEESSQGGVSDTDDVGSVSVPVDDEGFETLAAEIKEVLAELAQVFTFSLVLIMIGLLFTRARTS